MVIDMLRAPLLLLGDMIAARRSLLPLIHDAATTTTPSYIILYAIIHYHAMPTLRRPSPIDYYIFILRARLRCGVDMPMPRAYADMRRYMRHERSDTFLL